MARAAPSFSLDRQRIFSFYSADPRPEAEALKGGAGARTYAASETATVRSERLA